MGEPLTVSGTLYLVPNLLGLVAPAAVLPQGTIDAARALRRFVVENAKPARQFLKALDLPVPVAELAIETLAPNADRRACEVLLAPALAGEPIGLVSDAGCPGVADPGGVLVAVAHDLGVRVVPLVGPSALLLGLMAAGLNGQAFCFRGYLPVAPAEREVALRALDEEVARRGTTQLFIETPYRNEAIVESVLRACRPATRLCIAADLTLPTEYVATASVAAWRARERPALGKRPALFLLGCAPFEPSAPRGATRPDRPRRASS